MHIFTTKNIGVFGNNVKETLTNDVISFEQPAAGVLRSLYVIYLYMVGFNIAFNNFSALSQTCLDLTAR